MPRRDFDAARRERDRELDPIEFRLGGHDFACLTTIPIGPALGLVTTEESADDSIAAALVRLIKGALSPDDHPRFDEALSNPAEPVDLGILRDVAGYIAEEYSARPTSPSPASSAGRRMNGSKPSSPRGGKGSARSRA